MSQQDTDNSAGRRSFLTRAATVSVAAGAAAAAGTLASTPAAAATGGCKDRDKQMAQGLREGKDVRAAERQARDATNAAHDALTDLAARPSAKEIKLAQAKLAKATTNIENYLRWNKDGKATFIMVHADNDGR